MIPRELKFLTFMKETSVLSLLGMIKSQIPKGFKAEHYYKLKNTRQL